ncbi:GNAT family N-acetyltransferase [Clostridium hydrogenum]|uniref:GNAT family N-acetyltransferase n=1 Tax=Clostridium hydrogenum TaxID=2855764 RepID=UPI001F1B48F5|nr:GNAT family N-acetyltransferase [Clostridium hydrogenum]
MESLKLKNNYEIKILGLDKIISVYNLCVACSDYYILSDGVKPTNEDAKEIFAELPPDKNYEDKFVFGVFNNKEMLVGIVDIVRNFPEDGEWMIGLMILEPKERGSGLGKETHNAIAQWSKQLGAKTLRIGVIEENYNGIKFWTKLGYEEIKQTDMEFKSKKHIIKVMRFNI